MNSKVEYDQRQVVVVKAGIRLRTRGLGDTVGLQKVIRKQEEILVCRL